MKRFSLPSLDKVLPLLLFLVLLTMVANYAQQGNYQIHVEHEDLIHNTVELDLVIDNRVTEIVSLRVVNYDEITALTLRLRQVRHEIFQFSAEVMPAEWRQGYLDRSNRELELIEEIKTVAATVRNELFYLPTLLEERGESANFERFPLWGQTLLLVNHIYNYTLFSLDADQERIERDLGQFSQQLLTFSAFETEFRPVLTHLRQTLVGVVRLQQLRQQYHQIDSHLYLEELRERHEGQQTAKMRSAQLRSLLLLGGVALLLVGGWWLARRLHHAQQKLFQEHKRLQDAVDSMPEGFLLYNQNHQLQIFNDRVKVFYPWLKGVLALGCSEQRLTDAIHQAGQSHRVSLDGERLSTTASPPSSYYELTGRGRWLLVTRSGTDEGGVVEIHNDITQTKQNELKMRKMEHAIHQSPVAVIITDRKGVIEYVNPKFEEASGYRAEEVVGMNPRILKSGDMDQKDYQSLWSTISSGGEWYGEFHNRRKDGTLYWEHASISGIADEHGEITHYIAIKEDITKSRQLAEKMRIHSTVFATLSEGIMVTDSIGTIKSVNPAFTAITGYSDHEVLGHNASLLNSGRQEASFYAQMWQAIVEEGRWSGEIWNKRKDGTLYPQWLSIASVPGEVREYVAVFSDLTQRKEVEEKLTYRENYDQLTGLPNRSLLLDRIEHRMVMMKRDRRRMALLFIDLDRFKGVNDAFGHSSGDQLLQSVASRLQAVVRDGDTISRLGSDEFVVLLEDVEDIEDTALVANKITSSIGQPYHLEGGEIFIGASIGIALYPDDAKSAETLISNADIAMSQAKEDGRNRYHFFTEEMQKQVGERLKLEKELRKAVLNAELELYYQPVIRAGSGELFGVEALVRWNHPILGVVSPAVFIPLAEESDIIGAIGVWVLQAACEQGKIWAEDSSMPPLNIAVNLSNAQFEQGCGVGTIASILELSAFPPSQVTLEITETLLVSDKEVGARLFLDLKGLGVKLSIDDFGTGYSSLSYLKHFPVDHLKIDRSFIGQLREGGTDEALVRAIISMGKNLGLQLVAEGVEELDQLQLLQQLECDFIQGYYFSRPLPAAEFRAWLLSYQQPSTLTGTGKLQS
ncbi:MAG: EAL domain-containing protein [Gammaproteobacteria bacterium]|nr:EAL domain-containing protein [Gammaproteobacteria bacterium]